MPLIGLKSSFLDENGLFAAADTGLDFLVCAENFLFDS